MDLHIISKYLEKQAEKVVTKYDFDKQMITYTAAIKQNRDIKIITGEEEIVRAFLLTKLVNELGYRPENIEIEKEYDIGRPKVNKPRIDVVVRDNMGNAFLYIELKSPDEYEKNKEEVIEKQLFNLAAQEKGSGVKVKYLVLYSFEFINNEITDKCILIDYDKFKSFDAWEKVRDVADTIPARYGKAQKEPYIKGSKKDLTKNYSHAYLDSIRENLHNVLWGGGGTDDNDVFSSLTNIILAKIQDESEKKSGQKYEFQVLAFEKDSDEVFETNEQLFDRINNLYKRALKQRLFMTNQRELASSYVVDTRKFSLSKLKYAVSELERYSFVDGKNSLDGKDILGDFFEGIIRDGFKQSKGQFFTHINIVKFMLWALQLDRLAIDRINNDLEIPYLIDPSTGSGTFLIEYMKFITQNIKYRFRDKIDMTRDVEAKFYDWFLPDNFENKWAKTYIYGSEINFNLGTATKVNMILHGDGSTNIFIKDGLLPFSEYEKETAPNALKVFDEDKQYQDKNVNRQFDVIITNPPFSVTLDNDTKKSLDKDFIFGSKKNSENLFIERWYQLLRENGRFAAVLPESVFDTTENKYIRLFLYKYFKIKAVVSLPQITFEPYTSTKTSILFAQKKTKTEVAKWNELWAVASKEWSNLKTKAENIIAVEKGEKLKSRLSSIKNMNEQQEKEVIIRLLKNHIDHGDMVLKKTELINKFSDEISDVCKIDKDTKDIFGFVNTWWVFGEVAQKLKYPIFMAEVENIGYKRNKRGEKSMPNDLYRIDEKGVVMIDDGVKETVLDYIRSIEWD